MKIKAKTPPTSFFGRLWYEARFTREFEMETGLDIESACDALTILRKKSGWIFPKYHTVKLSLEDENRYDVDIQTIRRVRARRNSYVNFQLTFTAQAEGWLEACGTSSKMGGIVRLSGDSHLVFIIVVTVYLGIVTSAASFEGMRGIGYYAVGFVILFALLGMIQRIIDRLTLLDEIEAAFMEKRRQREAEIALQQNIPATNNPDSLLVQDKHA